MKYKALILFLFIWVTVFSQQKNFYDFTVESIDGSQFSLSELKGKKVLVVDSRVKWNFQKYMIDENGHLVDYANSGDKPFSDKIVNWIEGNN